jgi:hypothetical protein
LTVTQWAELQLVVDMFETQKSACDIPTNHGKFLQDDRPPRPPPRDYEVSNDGLIRAHTIFVSQSAQGSAREKRLKQGHASNPLTIGQWVAYPVSYTDKFPHDEKQECFVGKIVELNAKDNLVFLQAWNTRCLNNLTNKSCNPALLSC